MRASEMKVLSIEGQLSRYFSLNSGPINATDRMNNSKQSNALCGFARARGNFNL